MFKSIIKFLEQIFRPLEVIGHKYILAPFRWSLSLIDPLSHKVEGTLFKKILQVTIFPLFMILTVIVGFELVDGGYTKRTFFGTIIMFLILGAIFAPLERLIPYSRKWLDDKETPIDIMLFFGGKVWGDYINKPLRLATISLAV